VSGGTLSLVLHTHLPYVEGFDRWPFGEEWLFEAMASCYLPLLAVLDGGAPLTVSLTPVLADQLGAPGVPERFAAFVEDVRRETHRRDLAALDAELGPPLEHSLAQYEAALARLRALGGDLLGALAPHVSWTSAATHAVLPLLATRAGVRLQLRAGIESHRDRFGQEWAGGLWLPECAHAPWLDALLEEAGVHATVVDLTDVLGRDEHLRPLRSAAGPLLVPLDRATVELVWGARGYPSAAAYRSYGARTAHDHRPWANDGAPYDPARAREAVHADARDFAARVRERVAGGGLAVCAVDTELFGHWWHEGPWWLRAVLEEAPAQGLELAPLDDALRRHAAVPAPQELPVTSWGSPRDLTTWSGPQVAELAWRARDAELRVVAAGRDADLRAVRELLALQSSDWAFLVTHDLAAEYGHRRSRAHRAGLDEALAAPGTLPPEVRALAPRASADPLLEP
jgi:1,4-alpha-glucan branching enzyme